MSSLNLVANGAKLDDCHSTIFSLADLSEINWQKFSSNAAGLGDDPVLSAFTKCLALDILAVWRRTPKKSSDSSSQNTQDAFAKELWVFWWGEEPHVNEIAQHQGLRDEEKGCWKDGLSYECRTLLFKAIHNLVERCLLHESFVRIGQWFIKPLHSKEADEDISDRFSFSFCFFLHGESSVCTTVEVARHRSLERLNHQTFQQISSNAAQNSVILAPYGLKAKLSGNSFRSHDPVAKKLLEEWKSFYPIGNSDDNLMDESNEEENIDHIPIPPVVEVVIGGIRMNYPSYFVLVPLLESTSENMFNHKSNTTEIESSENIPKPSNYDPRSVQSISEMTPGFVHDTLKQGFSSNLQFGLKSSSKSGEFKIQSEELVVPTPRYFANRIRVKNKSATASWKTREKLISEGLNDDNDSEINEATRTACIKWNFDDGSLKKNSSNESGQLTSNTTRLQLERTVRHSNYGSFHHRSLESNNESNLQTLLSIPAPTSKENFCHEHAPELLFNDSILQPNTYLVNNNNSPTSEENLNKLNSKPFVSLPNSNGNPNWLSEEPVKSGVVDYASSGDNEVDHSFEMQRQVDVWRSYKFPHEVLDNTNKQKRLFSDCLDNINFVSSSAKAPYYCPRVKRMKVNSSGLSDHIPTVKSEVQSASDINCTVQHVSVGAVNGELAGMAVSSDPYAFEDVEDTISQTTNCSDISLKKSNVTISQNNWQAFGQSIYTKIEFDSFSNESATGKSELELLLRQNNSPAPPAALMIGSVPYPTLPDACKTAPKSLKEFSMEDLDEAMEKEDGGVPTPPEDPGDNRIHDPVQPTTVILPANGVTSYAVTDLQQMFPTPPSLEPCQTFSPPEGRIVHSVTSTQANFTTSNEIDLSVNSKRDIDRSQTNSLFLTNTANNPCSVDATSVLQSSRKMLNHPTSELYQPLPRLSQLPLHHTYAPSWLVPSSIPPITEECVVTLPGYPMNPPSTPAMTPGGATPCTPGHSSVRTPASVPPTSVPTPGRVGLCSIESTQSYQTPSSHGPNKGQFDPHGSAALHMNLLLSDSMLNIFRDKSFDQCALCVCNMNILGADVELGYLPALSSSEAQYPCSCGFSAVRNRLNSVNTGLFLEDEFEIVGLEHEREIIDLHKQISSPQAIHDEQLFLLIMEHCRSPFSVSRLIKEKSAEDSSQFENIVVKRDESEALAQALSIGLSTIEQPVKIEASSLVDAIHSWRKTQRDVLSCGNMFDLFRLLASLKPVLQDAIQRKRTSRSFGFTQHVRGPLTWREFCKEAGKNAEPQPIPSFIVGYDHDWLVVSPHALKYWEKLFLEPYSEQRDIAYLVVCPDDNQVVDAAKMFFKELSSMFESCRLGHLKPYNKKFADGILKIGQCSNSEQSSIDKQRLEWLSLFANTEAENKQKDVMSIFARSFIKELCPMLTTEQNFDLSSLHVRNNLSQNIAASNFVSSDRMPPPLVGTSVPSRPSTILTQSPSKPSDVVVNISSNNAEIASTIVLFILDPFQGLMSHALWRCYLSLQKSLPLPIKNHILLQIIPVDTILQATSSISADSLVQTLRSLSFSTFVQYRSTVPSSSNVRSMTGFGPKLTNRNILPKVDNRKFYAPLYVLADPHEKRVEPLGSPQPSSVLYVSYCLSRDQKWLLATATDQCGEMLESCYINIEVHPRRLALSRKQRVFVRNKAIEKLWKFCVTTCSQFSNGSWRVVIGKLGRLSHNEIQDWAKHLNKRGLQSSSKLRNCQQCKIQQKSDSSVLILSACLTSLEPDASLRILPDVVQVNNFGRGTVSQNQNAQLKTPDDMSCTHIYVFPTSAVTQPPGSNQAGVEDESYLSHTDPSILPDDVLEEFLIDFGGIIDDDPSNQNPHDDVKAPGGTEDASLLQQPLSLGYLVSTAPPGPLPSWFWTTCPQAKHRCPVFMRSALHIQTSVNEASVDASQQHPLDSHKTSVVLRYVLESYNALSWLTRDPVSRDRRSCLPVHCLSLAQLYHTVENFFYGSIQ